MQLHTLQSSTTRRKSRRIGRGGKRGTTAGRGTKGQKARAGHKIRPELRDTLKRIPKLRGYKFHSFRQKPAAISLALIEKTFSKGEVVTPETLTQKLDLPKRSGRLPRVKILGNTPLSKSLSIIGIPVSKSARTRIIEAGGSVRQR